MNEQVFFLINNLSGKNKLIDALMIFAASDLIYIIFLIAAIICGILLYKKQWVQVAYAAITLTVAFILLHIASMLYVDHRPFVDLKVHQLVSHAAGKSFPSDHTTAACAIGIAIYLFVKRKLGVALIFFALFIGFARIYVGIHYPIDILGGIMVALIAGSLTYVIKQRQYIMRFIQK